MTDAEMEILNLAGAGNVVLTERVMGAFEVTDTTSKPGVITSTCRITRSRGSGRFHRSADAPHPSRGLMHDEKSVAPATATSWGQVVAGSTPVKPDTVRPTKRNRAAYPRFPHRQTFLVAQIKAGHRAERPPPIRAPKYSWIWRIAMDPSPTADATRLTEPLRTSPAANTPALLVSSIIGRRRVRR
jgi:hypothetical protein